MHLFVIVSAFICYTLVGAFSFGYWLENKRGKVNDDIIEVLQISAVFWPIAWLYRLGILNAIGLGRYLCAKKIKRREQKKNRLAAEHKLLQEINAELNL